MKEREEEEEEEEEREVVESEVEDKRRKRRSRKGITDSAGISLLPSSFYPGTKLLFRRRLFEFGKPAE